MQAADYIHAAQPIRISNRKINRLLFIIVRFFEAKIEFNSPLFCAVSLAIGDDCEVFGVTIVSFHSRRS